MIFSSWNQVTRKLEYECLMSHELKDECQYVVSFFGHYPARTLGLISLLSIDWIDYLVLFTLRVCIIV